MRGGKGHLLPPRSYQTPLLKLDARRLYGRD
jgi:hypothetical protein